MSEFAVKKDRRRARLFATTGMLDAVSLILSSFSLPQSPKTIFDVTITAVATTTTNSPPPPHVAPVNFPTTTSLPPSPLRVHGLTALRSVPAILLRRLPPFRVRHVHATLGVRLAQTFRSSVAFLFNVQLWFVPMRTSSRVYHNQSMYRSMTTRLFTP